MPLGDVTVPPVVFTHLLSMTTDNGLYEHALRREPRLEHGYCTDDVARALTVVVRASALTGPLASATEVYLRFLERAVTPSGNVHNRMSREGRWEDDATTNDWWGRALAGLGSATRYAPTALVRGRAFFAFLAAAQQRSGHVRSCAFAAAGAADVLAIRPECDTARQLLLDCLEYIPRGRGQDWPWPETRMSYANGALCQALIRGGEILGQPAVLSAGLDLLDALLNIETAPQGYFSLTGSGGRGPEDRGPLFDQQPIEAATLSSACLDALMITHEPMWRTGVMRAWRWFAGDNDSRTPMYDPRDGAGYDGLERAGRNQNCGAESTLAALSTLQDVHALEEVPS